MFDYSVKLNRQDALCSAPNSFYKSTFVSHPPVQTADIPDTGQQTAEQQKREVGIWRKCIEEVWLKALGTEK